MSHLTFIKHSELRGLWNSPHIVLKDIQRAVEKEFKTYEDIAKMIDDELRQFSKDCQKRKWKYYAELNKELAKLREQENFIRA